MVNYVLFVSRLKSQTFSVQCSLTRTASHLISNSALVFTYIYYITSLHLKSQYVINL